MNCNLVTEHMVQFCLEVGSCPGPRVLNQLSTNRQEKMLGRLGLQLSVVEGRKRLGGGCNSGFLKSFRGEEGAINRSMRLRRLGTDMLVRWRCGAEPNEGLGPCCSLVLLGH